MVSHAYITSSHLLVNPSHPLYVGDIIYEWLLCKCENSKILSYIYFNFHQAKDKANSQDQFQSGFHAFAKFLNNYNWAEC